MKRRWVKILLVSLLLLAVAGFGAFSTFLFNPFEGRFEHDLSSLIPREVDFYLSKADLRADLDPFPVPAFFDELAADASGRALLELEEVRALGQELRVERIVGEVRAAVRSLPVEVDPLRVFGGADLALAGFFESGSGLEGSRWLVLGRASWMGKAAVEALRYPGLLGLSERGLLVDADDDVLALSGPALPQPVFVTRIRDVVIASSARELVERAHELEAARGQDSFGQSAKYADHVALQSEGEGDELEFFVDYRRLAASQGWSMALPDAYSENPAVALAGRLFQVVILRDLIGVLDLDHGFDLRATALVSSETMTPVQMRFYRERGFDKAGALEVAKFAPADAGLFAYLHADVGDLLREWLATADQDLVGLLDDRVRVVWDLPNANALVDELEQVLRDRVALVVRDDDYPEEGDAGPPHNEAVVPAWAAILWVNDLEKLEMLRDRVVARQGELGIKGREPGSKGVFIKSVRGGNKVYEYWSEAIPGTGEIATFSMRAAVTGGRTSAAGAGGAARPGGAEDLPHAEYFIVSNDWQMLEQMSKTFYDGGPSFPRLSDDEAFRSLVNTGLASASALLWLAPREARVTTRALADQAARGTAFIDWGARRPSLEREVLQRSFGGRARGSLDEEEAKQLEMLVDEAAAAYEEEIRGREVPRLQATYQRRLQALDLFRGLFAELAVDTKRFQLLVHGVVPLDDAGAGATAP